MNETDLLILAAEIERSDTQARELAQSEYAEREALEYVRTWARDSALRERASLSAWRSTHGPGYDFSKAPVLNGIR